MSMFDYYRSHTWVVSLADEPHTKIYRRRYKIYGIYCVEKSRAQYFLYFSFRLQFGNVNRQFVAFFCIEKFGRLNSKAHFDATG